MVTAFPLTENNIGLGAGTYSRKPAGLIHCETDGTFTITFKSGGTEAGYAMIAGEDRLLGQEVANVEVTAGTFSLA